MSTKKGDYELVTVRLFVGDREVLQRFFPNKGYNEVIRQLVNRLANQLREKENEIESNLEEISIDPTIE